MYEQIDLFQFILLNNDFYIPIDQLKCGAEYKNSVKGLLSNNWIIDDQGIWTFVFNPDNLFPEQGWKIHISAILENAKEILQRSVPVFIKYNVNFKFACDPFVLTLLNSKNWSRGGSGKFITVYPPFEKFKVILEELYQTLSGYDGPYILSDMRYKDSKVLYYRYGGFQPMEKLIIEGYRLSLIKDPEGNYIQDNRTPFYNPPPWVKDPFGKDPEYHDTVVLNNRYKILYPLSFSNSGGVYKAIDTFYNSEVIIKEARPFVSIQNNLSAEDLLRIEFEILKKIEDLEIAPKPLNYFKEWEHSFLVEELVNGMDLREYVVVNTPILKSQPSYEDFKEFFKNYRKIFINLIDVVKKLHERGIIFRDLSHNNIIVQEDLSVKLIDFESAYTPEIGKWIHIFTPGFASPGQLQNKRPSFADDIYSIGENLIAGIFPINAFFTLAPEARERFLKDIIRDMNFPNGLRKIIMEVVTKDRTDSDSLLLKIKKLRFPPPFKKKPVLLDNKEIKKLVNSAYRYIVTSSKNQNETGTLYPLYAEAYLTNPYGIAYGVSGVFMSLKYCGFDPPEEHVTWLLEQPLREDEIPPGLFVGMSGIAWALLEFGKIERAISVFKRALNHPLFDAGIDTFYGLSGIGLTALRFYYKLNEFEFLTEALKIAEKIRHRLEEKDGKLFFKGTDEDIHFGFAHGSTGLALLFLYIYLETGDEKYLEISSKLLQFDIEQAVPYKDSVSWYPSENNKNTVLPYVKYGTAGILSVLIRYTNLLNDDRYRDLIVKSLGDITRKYAIFPGQLNGLSGLGETIMDAIEYLPDNFVNKETLEAKLRENVKGISLFKVERPEGIAFPSDGLFRISCDFGTGVSGIMAFFCRILRHGKRLLFDIRE